MSEVLTPHTPGPNAERPAPDVNIEDVVVADDPRQWTTSRKTVTLAIIACAAFCPTMGVNIYNPAIQQIQQDLGATSQDVALSLSLFIVVQGTFPLLWSAISEIRGRKVVYICSMILFMIGSGVAGASMHVNLLIAMRVVQAAGASAVLAIGAGTLADIYAPHERGKMMGIYCAMPLLAPSLGPVIGGAITTAWGWRATFYALVVVGFLCFSSLLFFRDTFRQERSLAYQSAYKRARQRAEQCIGKESSFKRPIHDKAFDSEASAPGASGQSPTEVQGRQEVSPSLVDINPLQPILQVLHHKGNLPVLFSSAILFAFQYSICYTSSITFAEPPYSLAPLSVGLVLLSFGSGNVAGSILGGRWSDRVLVRLKEANAGQSQPAMRLQSTFPAMLILPPSVFAYAWLCGKKVHVAGPVTVLFFAGFAVMWIYSSTLAYIVDANQGRASSAVATNSCFRGLSGLIAAEIASPVQDRIGDGGLYSIWAGLLIIAQLLTLLVIWRGERWRKAGQEALETIP